MKIAPTSSQAAAPDEEATRMLPPRTATEETPAEMAGAPTARGQARKVWMLGGAAVVVLALGGLYLGSAGPAAPPPEASAAQGAAGSTATRTGNAKDTSPADQAKAVQPAKTRPKAAAEPPSPPATPRTTQRSSPASPAPPPKATTAPTEPRATSRSAAQDPEKACEGRILFSYLSCIKEQCAKPAFAQHRVCVEHREMEQRNLQPSL